MRDLRFVAVHRGGLLSPELHRLWMTWARTCAGHVVPLYDELPDPRLLKAMGIAAAWENGNTTVREARKAAWDLLALAREITNPVSIAVVRSVGHAVATAHMADHAQGAALYALKAISLAGKAVDIERSWQDDLLPEEIRELAVESRNSKESFFKLSG
jgi:hypothetical protein